jgi:ATP-dependent DNA helicase RecG
MARKYSRNRREPPLSERAFLKMRQLSRHIDRSDLLEAIAGGEDSYLEFKVRFSNPERLAAGICALANSGGGAMVFGVTDQLRLEGVANTEQLEQDLLSTCREQISPPVWARIDKVSYDSGIRLVVLEVDASRAPHRTADGRYYVRIGSTKREATAEEIAELYRRRTGAGGFEDVPVAASDMATDIDEGAVWSYVREVSRRVIEADGYRTSQVLADLCLASRYGDDLVATVAGVLLFGRDDAVARLMPNASIRARRLSGTTSSDGVVEEKVIVGNLDRMFEAALAFLGRYADLWDERPPRRITGPVAARPHAPRGAVVEIIANALVHRDWANRANTLLTIYDDRIELVNPASTAIRRRSMELGAKVAVNPRLHSVFGSRGYGAYRRGEGLAALLGPRSEAGRDRIRIISQAESFRAEVVAS